MIIRRIKRIYSYSLAVGLFLIVLFVALPQFYTAQNMSNLLLRAIPLLSVSVGQMVVLLIGGIDLSVGAVLSLATAIASSLMVHGIGLACLAVIVIGGLVGLVNGLGTTKVNINPFIMTLGTMYVVNGVALYLRPRPGGFVPRVYVDFILAHWGSVPVAPLFIFFSILAIGFLLLSKTTFGRHLYAIGGNEDAARLMGINVGLHKILAYVISGLFASLAGLYTTARIACGDATVGGPFLLDSIGAVVIGGTSLTGGRGALSGTLLGVLIFSTLSNVFNLLNVNIYWQYVFKGLIVISVVAISWAWERR